MKNWLFWDSFFWVEHFLNGTFRNVKDPTVSHYAPHSIRPNCSQIEHYCPSYVFSILEKLFSSSNLPLRESIEGILKTIHVLISLVMKTFENNLVYIHILGSRNIMTSNFCRIVQLQNSTFSKKNHNYKGRKRFHLKFITILNS